MLSRFNGARVSPTPPKHAVVVWCGRGSARFASEASRHHRNARPETPRGRPTHPVPPKSPPPAGITHSEFLIFAFHKHCFTNTASPQMRTLAGNEWALTADSPRPKGVGWPSHANSIEIHRQTTGLGQWGRTCDMRRTFRKKKLAVFFFLPILSFAEFAPS